MSADLNKAPEPPPCGHTNLIRDQFSQSVAQTGYVGPDQRSAAQLWPSVLLLPRRVKTRFTPRAHKVQHRALGSQGPPSDPRYAATCFQCPQSLKLKVMYRWNVRLEVLPAGPEVRGPHAGNHWITTQLEPRSGARTGPTLAGWGVSDWFCSGDQNDSAIQLIGL